MDAAPTMVNEDRGGLFAYKSVNEEVRILINELRSSTLFNLILYDQNQIIPYQNTLVPATAAHKTNLLEWVASINTQTHQLGLQNDTRSASITSGEYEIPMQTNDITGWLKAAQFGTTLQPELIFFLSGEWGSVTDSENEFSYFARFDVLERYLDERLKALLSDEDIADEWEEVAIELEELVPVAEKMIELENQARAEELLDPKISASKDRILWENNVDQPDWITLEEPDEIGIYPAETRYTFEEVMQTLFIFTMERYQEKGFPEMHFVLLDSF